MSDTVRIADIRVILTAPAGCTLVIVRVDTTEPGLYGLGCATFTQRALAVKTGVEEYLKPLLLGRDVDRIEDIWQTSYVHSYWRNGPVLNNGISGVDMALWDIKGKRAGMPVYQLLGGKCREAAAVYRHADGSSPTEVEDHVRRLMAEGYHYIRAQMGGYGGRPGDLRSPEGAQPGAYYDAAAYARSVPRLFEHLRATIGFDVELLHDVHERLWPTDAIVLAKALEPYRLFFLEDPLAPEDLEYFQAIKAQCATPIAMGELFNSPREWTPLIAGRLIDWHNQVMAENKARTAPGNGFEPPYTTLHVGVVNGGTAVNITAENCMFTHEVRCVPGESFESYEQRYRAEVAALEAQMQAIAPETGIDFVVTSDTPAMGPEENGAAEELCRRLTGDNGRHVVAYGTEGGLFQRAGWSTVVCGPGDIAQAHQPDEFITLDQLEAGTQFVRKLIADLAR